jgi:hypothetical protein
MANEEASSVEVGILDGLVENGAAAREAKIHPITLRRKVAASGGQLKEIRIGRSIYYEVESLKAFLRGDLRGKRR